MDPCYFPLEKKNHKTLCKTTMKGMRSVWSQEHAISPCLDSAHQAVTASMWDFVVSLSGHTVTAWTQTQNREGMAEIWAQTHSVLIACWQYLMVTEQDVL